MANVRAPRALRGREGSMLPSAIVGGSGNLKVVFQGLMKEENSKLKSVGGAVPLVGCGFPPKSDVGGAGEFINEGKVGGAKMGTMLDLGSVGVPVSGSNVMVLASSGMS